jgi:hypothetical protein
MTVDVDVSVFVPWSERRQVVASFAELGLHPTEDVDAATPVAGIRLTSDDQRDRVDLFLALSDAYDAVLARAAPQALGRDGEVLPFFSADDVVTFKLSFNRAKDWVDIESIIRCGTALDEEVISETLLALRGPSMHPRLARLRAMIATGGERP